MNNNTDLVEIITMFKTAWEALDCDKDDIFNEFHFGYPHEVDENNSNTSPFMICNYPNSASAIPEYEGNYVNTTTDFTLQIYFGYPNGSIYPASSVPFGGQVVTNLNSLEYWDQTESCFYEWLTNVLNALGSKVVLGSGSVQISRRDQASNNQVQKMEVRFNLKYWRYCLNLVQ